MIHRHFVKLVLVKFVLTASIILGISQSGFADPPAHAQNNKPQTLFSAPPQNGDHSDKAAACPPGLAKKTPDCVPPGQAKKAYRVGDVISWDDVHVVSQPGYYGLSTPPTGDRYAIVNGQLVRVDEESRQILSILRMVEAILD